MGICGSRGLLFLGVVVAVTRAGAQQLQRDLRVLHGSGTRRLMEVPGLAFPFPSVPLRGPPARRTRAWLVWVWRGCRAAAEASREEGEWLRR